MSPKETKFQYVLKVFFDCAGSNASVEVTAVVGGDAWLPCNVAADSDEERTVGLVLWYKDNSSTPVYTVDARWGSLLQGARHFPGEEEVELAARLSFDARHQPALLRVARVEAEDAGVYRCRVDYRQARTEVTLAALRVIVPPRELIVLDEYGQRQVDVLGPYNEGATVLLVCEVEGGDPPPEVLWFKDGELLDSSFSVLWPQGVVRNEVQLGPLRRRDLLVALQCRASNNNVTEALTAHFTLDLTLKPTEVKVSLPALSHSSAEGATLVAGEMAEARCLAKGARPMAQVAWFKGGHRLQHDRFLSREPGSTLSAVSFVVRAEDHGAQLTCRADNPSLPGSEISDFLVLDVHYPPQLSLTASEQRPREGDNVTLRCDWSANPVVNAVWWRRDGQLLEWRNEVLHLVNVTRAQSGLYECLASNRFGESFSNQLRLSIQYAPECAEGQREEYASSPELRIACEVRANPSDELHFEWLANTTRRVGRINSLAVNGTRALARAVADRELEYGSLLCWASNRVGKQRQPCIFRIVPPAPPGRPHSCNVTAHSQDGIAVTCAAGSTGGLPVTFIAELLSEETASHPALLRNATDARWPRFVFEELPREGALLVRVYALNSQGRSAAAEVRLPAGLSLLHEPSPAIDANSLRLPGHVIGFLITAVVALAIVIVSLTVTRHWKRRRRRKDPKHLVELQKLQKHSPQKSFCECASDDVVFQSPDLITSKYGVPDQAVTVPALPRDVVGGPALDVCYRGTAGVDSCRSPTVQLKLTTFVGSPSTEVRKPASPTCVCVQAPSRLVAGRPSHSNDQRGTVVGTPLQTSRQLAEEEAHLKLQ
ncbi:hypothetical protein V5799_030266 [Amblyomma americanum]|uniref:Ig-like domain-containing protein n=1 Tax=Amblyomma americanum TaxID=6943 RepID=A0AAQ4ENQ7_AMBAM